MMFAILIMGLIARPAVSLYGSPTLSPVTAAAWASEPLPPYAPSSMSFFALSQAPPPDVIATAEEQPGDDRSDQEELAQHDPERFGTPPTPPYTNDEESSGVIDAADILGDGWYLLDVQAHYPFGDPAIVEGGQLLAMHVPPGKLPKK